MPSVKEIKQLGFAVIFVGLVIGCFGIPVCDALSDNTAGVVFKDAGADVCDCACEVIEDFDVEVNDENDSDQYDEGAIDCKQEQ